MLEGLNKGPEVNPNYLYKPYPTIHQVNDVQLASMTVMNSFKTFLKVEWLF